MSMVTLKDVVADPLIHEYVRQTGEYMRKFWG